MLISSWVLICTLPDTNKAPENRPSQKEMNHLPSIGIFRGKILVLGSVSYSRGEEWIDEILSWETVDIPNKYPTYKVYVGLIIKGTIPRVPPFTEGRISTLRVVCPEVLATKMVEVAIVFWKSNLCIKHKVF